jgi:hypothetical protein
MHGAGGRGQAGASQAWAGQKKPGDDQLVHFGVTAAGRRSVKEGLLF